MPEQIRVNIKHRVNNSAIKREKRNGRDVVVVPSAVAKFDTVLNGILYPREELEASYQGLERTPAPLGHPMIGNAYAPARDPEAINTHHIGGWNERVRIEGDRIMADMVIDVEYAKRHPDGDRLLNALESGEPISTSTGLYMEREPAPEGAEYNFVGRNYSWDHLAVLLDKAPAIGTDAGIGLLVNGQQVEVVESELKLNEELPGSVEDMRRALQQAAEEKYGNGFIDDFNGESLIFFQMEGDKTYKIGYSVLDGKVQISDQRKEVQRKTTWEAVTNTIRNTLSKMFGTAPDATPKAAGLNVNSDEAHHMTPEELKAALDQQAETLTAAFNAKLDETVKPLQERIDAMNADREAAAKAEHEAAVEAVVNAKLMDKEEAEAMPTAALNALTKATKRAAPLAPGMACNSADDSAFDTLPD